jgi:excisionase family DNA binding protein
VERGMQLTVQEASKFLEVSESTVTRWIKQRGLPAQHVGGQYRFNRAEVLEWAAANQVKVSLELFDHLENDEDPDGDPLTASIAVGPAHGSLAHAVYGQDVVRERHRHRFEFNNTYLQRMMNAGLRFSGFSRDGLVEIIELPQHPFFVASQYHPEFRSTPRDGHPLFTGFIRAARAHRAAQLPQAAGA